MDSISLDIHDNMVELLCTDGEAGGINNVFGEELKEVNNVVDPDSGDVTIGVTESVLVDGTVLFSTVELARIRKLLVLVIFILDWSSLDAILFTSDDDRDVDVVCSWCFIIVVVVAVVVVVLSCRVVDFFNEVLNALYHNNNVIIIIIISKWLL